jgi:hypothetical protein
MSGCCSDGIEDFHERSATMPDTPDTPRMIFVNLPVADLARSKAFYEAIGFTNEPRFTDDTPPRWCGPIRFS